MNKQKTLFSVFILISFLTITNSAFAMLSAQERCDIVKHINNNNATSEEQNEYDQYTDSHDKAKKAANSSSKPYYYISRNPYCSDEDLAGRAFIADRYPCAANKERNDGYFCFRPSGIGAFDKAMIQEYGRAMWGNLFDGKHEETQEYYDKRMFQAESGTNGIRIINYTIDDGQTNGKRVYAQATTGISDKAFSTLDKVKKYCKFVNSTSDLHESTSVKGSWICSNINKDQCEKILDKFLSQIQVSPTNPTLVGVSAQWRLTSSEGGSGVEECVVDIP